MKTTQQLNYAAMSRAELVHETTKLALATEAAEIAGNQCKALELSERYHWGMAWLIAKSADGGPSMPAADAALARKRAERTRRGHLDDAAACRRLRLGLAEGVPA